MRRQGPRSFVASEWGGHDQNGHRHAVARTRGAHAHTIVTVGAADETPSISSSWPGARSLDLDDLVDELRARARAARLSQDRMSQLLDAVVAMSADLDLAEVLGRIVESATALVGTLAST